MESFRSQQYYQQPTGTDQANMLGMGVSAPSQMNNNPFAMNQQQIAYYAQLFYTMVRLVRFM